MYTILISTAIGLVVAFIISMATATIPFSGSFAFAGFLVVFVGFNFYMGRKVSRQVNDIFGASEQYIKSGKYDEAIELLKGALPFSNWQLLLKGQINANIGILLYTIQKFDEALPYLTQGFKSQSMAAAMLGSYYFKQKDLENLDLYMKKSVKKHKKVGFIHALYGYFLIENGKMDEAISVLSNGVSVCPSDEKLEALTLAVKNGKKMKMQTYGHQWLNLHIAKVANNGAKPYQMHLMNKKNLGKRPR